MENQEQWFRLCEQAAIEQDPLRLMELVTEIDRLLREKEERLKAYRTRNDVPRPGTGS